MKISKADFLVLNLSGIELFIQTVSELMLMRPELTYEEAVKETHRQVREYVVNRDVFAQRPAVAVLAAPLTLPLGQLLSRDTCNSREYRGVSLNVVYIVRDGEAVRYVGSTRYDARTRMKSHQKAHSPLGKALRANPDTRNWSVEMIPHADYREAAAREKELINQLNPTFCRRQY